MKSIKEITGFLDQNMKWLLENPNKVFINYLKQNDYGLLDIPTDRNEKFLLKLILKNSNLVVPEGPDSANYLGVKIGCVEIKIKDSYDIPKLITSIKEKLQIIDNKSIFNTKSFDPEFRDYVPFANVDIVGLYISAYFYINKTKEDIGKITRLKMTVKSPKVDSKLFLLRKIHWQSHSNIIVSAKPRLNLILTGAEIQTNLARLLCFKFIVKSNFDEKSRVIEEEDSSTWDSIDFSFEINKAVIGLDIFKIPETFSDKPTKLIDEALPGKYADIEFDFV